MPDASTTYRRIAETINNTLNFNSDDSRARTAAEIAAGVTPTNYAYLPGVPERYGAAGDGTTDDTAALTTCYRCNDRVQFTAGKIYGVTTFTHPRGGPHHVNFNSAAIRGIASSGQTAIYVIKTERTVFIDYKIDAHGNQNYRVATWWYDSAHSSQYNVFFGMTHSRCVGACRTFVFGALPGDSSTAQAQSENAIHGWNTYGCQNPCYINHSNGRLFFYAPIFVCNNDYNDANFRWANARMLEVQPGGVYYVTSGELQFSGGTGQTYAAELANVFVTDSSLETPIPLNVNADGVYFKGGIAQITTNDQSAYRLTSGWSGRFTVQSQRCFGPSGAGSYAARALIDASLTNPTVTFTASVGGATSGTLSAAIANGTYVVIFQDGERRNVKVTHGTSVSWSEPLSLGIITAMQYNLVELFLEDMDCFEWGWAMAGRDAIPFLCPRSEAVHMSNVHFQITASDPNVYVINQNPTDSMTDSVSIDAIGYSTQGWSLLVDHGSTNSLTAGTHAGPFARPSAQIVLSSNGQAAALIGNPTSLSSLQATAFKVAPGERYFMRAYCQLPTGGRGQLCAQFWNSSGRRLSTAASIADQTSIASGAWVECSGPFVVPATAAYMMPGMIATAATIWGTDFELRRA